jgi:hypothetical protein
MVIDLKAWLTGWKDPGTLALAAVGALTGITSLLWQVWRELIKRVKLFAAIEFEIEEHSPEYLRLQVINHYDHEITVGWVWIERAFPPLLPCFRERYNMEAPEDLPMGSNHMIKVPAKQGVIDSIRLGHGDWGTFSDVPKHRRLRAVIRLTTNKVVRSNIIVRKY